MTRYVPYQLANDPATYGPDAGKFIVTTADFETEVAGPMSEKDASLFAKLLATCQMVVDRWEKGDLAEAARECAEAVQIATGRTA